jgi:hypothetical protein
MDDTKQLINKARVAWNSLGIRAQFIHKASMIVSGDGRYIDISARMNYWLNENGYSEVKAFEMWGSGASVSICVPMSDRNIAKAVIRMCSMSTEITDDK